ncbi:hypothetical protein COU54_00885 [Candidatus Pacearchaeota archaeon CG10_big_fil_rev_8_21_14_0_10_31_24]|nr:MAG: hypothetical protein COU54_00885 [Candidatus Pacearchaeota archaeon CG10_big_fil_rev_8_21_14_0_10_31_24]
MKKNSQTRVIILEGVTTTGKSTIFNNLKRYAEEHKLSWFFIPEIDTIIPIIDNIDQTENNEHFKKLLKQTFSKKYDLYIFDRLHFSSIFKTGAQMKDLQDLEKTLSQFDTQIFMLYVPEDLLRERIRESMKYRDVDWTKYLLNKVGGNKEKVADFYIERQNFIKKLIKESILKINIIDTSDQNFVKATRQIIDILRLRSELD